MCDENICKAKKDQRSFAVTRTMIVENMSTLLLKHFGRLRVSCDRITLLYIPCEFVRTDKTNFRCRVAFSIDLLTCASDEKWHD